MTDPIWGLPADRLDLELVKLPSVVTWSRLEPLSLTADLTPGLQTLLGDPLWLLGRQWQFGELRGEDAGTPISAIVEVEHAPIGRLRPGASGEPVDVVDESVPLEARIEAEPVAVPATRVRAEAGLQLLRRLAGCPARHAAGRGGRPLGVRRDRARRSGPGAPRPHRRRTRRRVRRAGTRRSPGRRRVRNPWPRRTAVRSPVSRPGWELRPSRPRTAAACWASGSPGTRATCSRPTVRPGTPTGRSTPSRSRPTSAAAGPCSRPRSTPPDGSTGPTSTPPIGDLGPSPAGRQGAFTRQVRLPTPASFPGMPADRLWEFEDGRVYLGGLEAGPTDLARMALVEFALAYGVDWFALPVELPAGSLYWVHQLDVLDTFGRSVSLGSAREPGGWSMFGLAAPGEPTFVADALFVPPVALHVLQSEPLEEVALFRDEMANLVWGVERVVQAPSGQPVNRTRLAPKVSLRQQVPDDLGDAAIVYRLMTPVPDHWVPFVAVPGPFGRRGRAGAAPAAPLPRRRDHRRHPPARHVAVRRAWRAADRPPARGRGGGAPGRRGRHPALPARPHPRRRFDALDRPAQERRPRRGLERPPLRHRPPARRDERLIGGPGHRGGARAGLCQTGAHVVAVAQLG